MYASLYEVIFLIHISEEFHLGKDLWLMQINGYFPYDIKVIFISPNPIYRSYFGRTFYSTKVLSAPSPIYHVERLFLLNGTF